MSEVKERVIVSAAKKEMVPMLWPLVSGLLQKAINHSNGEMTPVDVLERMCAGSMLLVTITEGEKIVTALALEQRSFSSGKKVLNLTLAGGEDLHKWMHQLDEITQNLAKDYGCDEIYIVGRAGWVRALRDIGFNKIHTVVTKKVGE